MYYVKELVEVRSPAKGEIDWYKADGAEVGPEDKILGVVIYIDENGKKKIKNIYNPLKKDARGIFFIVPETTERTVGIGRLIALIRVTALLYAGKVNSSKT